MTKRKSDGDRLRQRLDASLAKVAKATGRTVQWSDIELVAIDEAVALADRAESLRDRFDALNADENANGDVLLRWSAELRLLSKLVVDLVAKVDPNPEPKGNRHVAAARTRWDRG
ncbi:hypothetical protein [Mycolicibacterium fortuitum]